VAGRIWELVWRGETKKSGAGAPFPFTSTPVRLVGRGFPLCAEPVSSLVNPLPEDRGDGAGGDHRVERGGVSHRDSPWRARVGKAGVDRGQVAGGLREVSGHVSTVPRVKTEANPSKGPQRGVANNKLTSLSFPLRLKIPNIRR